MAVTEYFSTKILSRITGLSLRQIDEWVWRGLISPLPSTTHRRRWSFHDLVTIRAMAELRRAGIPPAALERISERLKTIGASFVDAYLVASGDVVCMVHEAGLMSVLKAPGQFSYTIVYDLQQSAEQVRRDLAEAA
jgi:DNA-binding transcriptional MerR regulator